MNVHINHSHMDSLSRRLIADADGGGFAAGSKEAFDLAGGVRGARAAISDIGRVLAETPGARKELLHDGVSGAAVGGTLGGVAGAARGAYDGYHDPQKGVLRGAIRGGAIGAAGGAVLGGVSGAAVMPVGHVRDAAFEGAFNGAFKNAFDPADTYRTVAAHPVGKHIPAALGGILVWEGGKRIVKDLAIGEQVRRAQAQQQGG